MIEQRSQIETLIAKCIKWDRVGQKQLYQLFYAYGMHICLRYTKDKENAVEILNMGFLKVFTSIKSFKTEQPFQPWFKRILINTAINSIKQKQKWQMETDIEKVPEIIEKESTISGITYNEVLTMLTKLPPAYKLVFNLYAIEGYKHEEIAKMLNISIGTSKSNLHKANHILKGTLTRFFDKDYA